MVDADNEEGDEAHADSFFSQAPTIDVAEEEAALAPGDAEDSSPALSETPVSAAPEVAFADAEPESAEAPESAQREASAAEEEETTVAAQQEETPVEDGPAEEAQADASTAQAVVETQAAEPAAEEISASGRAVNDPRVAPSPVTEVHIETGRITLFSEEAAPPVDLPDRNVSRASNDPRGPRATGTG
jgi:ribonuclease E